MILRLKIIIVIITLIVTISILKAITTVILLRSKRLIRRKSVCIILLKMIRIGVYHIFIRIIILNKSFMIILIIGLFWTQIMNQIILQMKFEIILMSLGKFSLLMFTLSELNAINNFV